MYEIPLAYKYVVIMAMVSEVNHNAVNLHLPITLPMNASNNISIDVFPPQMQKYGGSVTVDNYVFTFYGTAQYIYRVDKYGFQSIGVDMERDEALASGIERASMQKYSVGTNDIYKIATNILTELDINITNLVSEKEVIINRNSVLHSSRGLVLNPLMDVDWCNSKRSEYDHSEIYVQISAIDGQLLKFMDHGGKFNMRVKPIVIKFDELASIRNEDFEKFSYMERSNLLVNFSGLHCADLQCPWVDNSISLHGSNGTNAVHPEMNSGPKSFGK